MVKSYKFIIIALLVSCSLSHAMECDQALNKKQKSGARPSTSSG